MLLGTATYLHLTTSEPEGQGDLVRIQAERLPLLPTPDPQPISQPVSPPDHRLGPPPHQPEPAAPVQRANQAATPCKLERLVRPARRLTLAQARLLDLSNAQLEKATDLDEALEDLLGFAEGSTCWIVAQGRPARATLHSIALQLGLPSSGFPPLLGLDETSAVVHPTLPPRDLPALLQQWTHTRQPNPPPGGGGPVAISTGDPIPAAASTPESRSPEPGPDAAELARGPGGQGGPSGRSRGDGSKGTGGLGQPAAVPTAPAPTDPAAPDPTAPDLAPPDSTPPDPAWVPGQLHWAWQRLEGELLGLPLALLAEMNWLLARHPHPLKALLRCAEQQAVAERMPETFAEGKLSLAGLFQDHSEIIKRLLPPKDEWLEGAVAAERAEAAEPVAAAELQAFFGPGGRLARALPGYEDRPQQLAMALQVGEALSAGRHLVAEAGTGVGKSLAYLVPALLFAKRNSRPLIVSTHTKNLQSQLFHKDLALLAGALEEPFSAALLKGRPNYLCARKLMYTLQESAHELEDEEREALLPILSWATRTRDGDVAELAAFSPEEHPALWDRLHTVGEDCLSRQCPFYHRCFVYRARGLARQADLVVTNHALVFADLNQEAGSLPPYREIVFDEAHSLEQVATDFLACEITPRRMYRILNRLFRTAKGSAAGKGLLPTLLFQLDQARGDLDGGEAGPVRALALAAMQAVEPATAGADGFFEALREWFAERMQAPGGVDGIQPHVPRERGRPSRPAQARTGGPAPEASGLRPPYPASGGARRSGEERFRFSGTALQPLERQRLERAKELLVAGLGQLRQVLEQLLEAFQLLKKAPLPRARELKKELAAQNLFLQELITDVEFVVRADEPNYVFWIEQLGKRSLRLVAAPLDLSAILHGQLYSRRRAVILTSATLSVREAHSGQGQGLAPRFAREARGPLSPPPSLLEPPVPATGPLPAGQPPPKSFEFLKRRLGLTLCQPGEVGELLEGSPFDYARQCRLFVPTFLPEPEGSSGGTGYTRELQALLAALALASQGRALALFTSHGALRGAAAALRGMLAPAGIEVLAQGADGSREALLERLRTRPRTLLLGTASFWEGVDVPGEALSLLVIAKLPFAVFTDPLVQGRCELLEAQGKDPFLHFSVPQAIIRLRQGFGRLIRSKQDRGVVVLCDRRVLTKRYGPAFLRALPCEPEQAGDSDWLAGQVREFLEPAVETTPEPRQGLGEA